jgi:nitrogen fixation/metabolism regulation signal transduction histidine kinase
MAKAARRIEDLTIIAQRVAEGHEELRAPVVSRDEVGTLADSFNRMLDRLAQSRALAADMEKKAAWRELARVLAHEIKNPLTPIQLSVQQLADTYKGDDDTFARTLATTREIVNEEVDTLRRLTREFSEFARAPQIEPEENTILELLRELEQFYAGRVELHVSQDPGLSVFDREKVKRALINLVDNALSVSPEHDPVRMSLAGESGRIVIEVEDNGPGITSDRREKVFEPYFTTKRSGVGLGLPIVRTTAEQHGGYVEALDALHLKGARFRFVLPRRPPEDLSS